MIRLNIVNNKYGANTQKKREMAIIKIIFGMSHQLQKYPIKINCIWHVTNNWQ